MSGRKVFTAGQVLAAADVMEFLMDQSVQIYSGTAARGSALNALGTAAEGIVTYLTDSNTITVYDGSAWQTVYPVSVTPAVNSITSAYTAVAGDANDTIYVSGTAAVTITIPDVLSVGDRIDIWRNAGGTVTIVAGSSVTDWAGAGTAGTSVQFKINETYNAATVQKVAANTYRVVGKITA